MEHYLLIAHFCSWWKENTSIYLLFGNATRIYVIIVFLLYSFIERRYVKFLDSSLNRKYNSSKYKSYNLLPYYHPQQFSVELLSFRFIIITGLSKLLGFCKKSKGIVCMFIFSNLNLAPSFCSFWRHFVFHENMQFNFH